MTCCFCGFTSKSKACFVAMADDRIRCKSGAACARRLRSGEYLKGRVRLQLENPPTAAADDPARKIRAALYRYGLCVDCGVRSYSPGRPRCDDCHRRR